MKINLRSFILLAIGLISFFNPSGCAHAPSQTPSENQPAVKAETSPCTQETLQIALNTGQKFNFECQNPVIPISKPLKLVREGFELNGNGKMILEWTGTNNCSTSKKDSYSPVIEVRGNLNRLKGFEIRGNSGGIAIISGINNEIKDVTFKELCAPAIWIGPSHSTPEQEEAFNTQVLENHFEQVKGPGILVQKGSALVEQNKFEKTAPSVQFEEYSKLIFSKNKVLCPDDTKTLGVLGLDHGLLQAQKNRIENCDIGFQNKSSVPFQLTDNEFQNVKSSTTGDIQQKP